MRGEGFHLAVKIGGNVLAFAGQLEKGIDVAGEGGDFFVLGDLLLKALPVLHDLLGFFGLIPEVGGVDLVVGEG
jgi:hypothetical protein